MPQKLASVVAVEKGVKQRANKNLGEAHKTLQKLDLFLGLARDYSPLDEEDTEKLPSENKPVIARVDEITEATALEFADLWNVTATKDYGNTTAVANVEVDGQVLIENAPVPFLLFMQKQLDDVIAILRDLPTLDASEEWSYDENNSVWRSKTQETMRTKKVPRNHVLAEATPEHPAQVQMFTEDVIVGKWSKTTFSSAVPASVKKSAIHRAEKVLDAVKTAREEANSKDVEHQKVAAPVLNWILQPLGVQIEQ